MLSLHRSLFSSLCIFTLTGTLFASEPAYRADRILIRPKVGQEARLSQLHQSLGSIVLHAYPRFNGLQVLTLPAGATAETWVRKYQDSGLVEYAEFDQIQHANVVPNDPFIQDGTQWAMINRGQNGGTADADIDATEAWNVINQAPAVVVAVIDTGINYDHEDLKPNLWRNPREIAGNRIDDDHNGYVDDVYGIDSRTGSGDPKDDNGHGSHTSGTIGAVGNNGRGVVGVAWKVQIMACRFLGGALGSGSDSDAVECINYAIANGAQVMSNSWGGGGADRALAEAIDGARRANIIFVAAAGNGTLLGRAINTDEKPNYPSCYDLPNIVSVAATDRNDQIASFSNFGLKTVDLAAPGVDIISCWMGGPSVYNTISGTSMATPAVSGLFALLKARYPNELYSDLIVRALHTVDHIPSMRGKCVSNGRMNLATAVTRNTVASAVNASAGGRSVNFTDRSVGPVNSLRWDFGDGTSSTDANPLKAYRTAGTYQASLTAFGPTNSDTFTQTVVVK